MDDPYISPGNGGKFWVGDKVRILTIEEKDMDGNKVYLVRSVSMTGDDSMYRLASESGLNALRNRTFSDASLNAVGKAGDDINQLGKERKIRLNSLRW